MKTLFALLAALACATPSFAWWQEGHQAVALIAEHHLSPEARRHVEALLGSDDMAAVASWMDDLRNVPYHEGPLADDPLAHHITQKFPKNQTWHYVDLPLGTTHYDPKGRYERPDDIVHIIGESIAVLEGRSTSVEPKVALYMLIHFVGDIHQPLHVSCGFFDISGTSPRLVTDPDKAYLFHSDQGANALRFGPGSYDNLHAVWDGHLPEVFAHSKDPAVLAQRAALLVTPEQARSPGDYHAWASLWADESVRLASGVYQGLVYGAVKPGRDGAGFRSIAVTLPADYDAVHAPQAGLRIAQAGYRLADVLNSLAWKS